MYVWVSTQYNCCDQFQIEMIINKETKVLECELYAKDEAYHFTIPKQYQLHMFNTMRSKIIEAKNNKTH